MSFNYWPKEIHPREAGLSPSASAGTLAASIRLLSRHTEVAEKFNYLSPTSLNLLSSLGQTHELEFLSRLKHDVGSRDEVCSVLSTEGSVIPFHLCDTHGPCGQREGPPGPLSNGLA